MGCKTMTVENKLKFPNLQSQHCGNSDADEASIPNISKDGNLREKRLRLLKRTHELPPRDDLPFLQKCKFRLD